MAEKKNEAKEDVAASLNKALGEFEKMEKQLEVILIQKNQLKLQLSETKNAEEELKHATGDVYKSVGSLVFKTTKEKAEKDLKEKKELIDVKLNALGKEEVKLREAIKELQASLQAQMKEYGAKKK